MKMQHEQPGWSIEAVCRKVVGYTINFCVAVVLLLSLILVDKAHGQVRAFTLETPIADRVLACLEKEDAMDIANSGSRLQGVASTKVKAGVCRVVEWAITYHELVYQTKSKKGELLAVYRGTVNKKDIFVPMRGWAHIEFRI